MNLAISKNASTNLKIIFSLLVFMHHFTLTSGCSYLSFFEKIGSYCVGVFFFLSGYGLMKSLAAKGDGYLNGFFNKRILTVLKPFIIALVLYQLIQYFVNPVVFKEIINELSVGDTIHFLPNCWYIPVQLFFYLVFFFVVKAITNNTFRLAAIFLLSLTYLLLMYSVGFNGHWYNPSFCFFFGCIYSKFDNKEVKIYIPLILLLIVGLTSKIRFVSAPLFCVSIAMLSDALDRNTNQYLSKRYYHFYLAQAFSLTMLITLVPEFKNNLPLFFGASVLIQIIITEFLYRADMFVKKSK